MWIRHEKSYKYSVNTWKDDTPHWKLKKCE